MLSAVLALAACQDPLSSGPVSPRAQQIQSAAPTLYNDHIPVAFTAYSFCTGESFDVSGEIHVTTKIWYDADRLRIQGHINLNLAGIGLSTGLRLRLQQITNSDFTSEWTSGIAEANQVFMLRVISQTSSPNAYLTMNGTFLFDPVGGVQVIPKKWEFVCR